MLLQKELHPVLNPQEKKENSLLSKLSLFLFSCLIYTVTNTAHAKIVILSIAKNLDPSAFSLRMTDRTKVVPDTIYEI